LRERGFELKGRLVSERRVSPVFVVDISDEAIDAATGVADVGEGAIGIRSTSQKPGWESEPHTYRDDALSPMLTRLGFAVAIHDNPLH
jgi:hypothetical protein